MGPLPPLPPGAKLDQATGLPPLPAGARLDAQESLPPLPVQGAPGGVPPPTPPDPTQVDEQIMRRFGYDPAFLRTAKAGGRDAYRPGMLADVADAHLFEGSKPNRFMHGLGDLGQAIGQGVQRVNERIGLQNKAATALHDLIDKLVEQSYQKAKPEGLDVARFAGNMAPTMAALPASVPLQGGKAALTAALLRSSATGAGASVLQPAEVTPADGGRSDNFGAQKVKQAAIGAVLAPVGQAGVERVVAPGLGRVVNIVAGKLNDGAREVADLGRQWGVRLSTADMGAGTRKLEGVVGDIPLSGMSSWLKGQKGEAGVAAKKLLDSLNGTMKNMGWEGLADVEAQAAGQGARAKEAQALLRGAADADQSGDWSKILQTSGGMKVFAEKLKSDKLYSASESMAPSVPMTGTDTLSAIQSIRAKMTSTPGAENQNRALLGYLDALEADLKAGSGKDLTFGGFGKLRSALRAMKQKANAGTGELSGTETSGYLGQIQSAVERDQAAFAQQQGGAFAQARKAADRNYAQNVAPYKDKALANALRGAHPDEVFQKYILKGGLEDRSNAFYNLLDPKGQAAVKAGLIDRAIDEATKTGNFSPDAFAIQMRNYRGARNAIFLGEDKWKLDGFTKLMESISGSSAFAQSSPNGRMAWTGGLIVGAATNLPLAAKTLAAGAALKQLFTTSVGKRFLLSASDLKPGSPAMWNLINKELPKVVGNMSGAQGPDADTTNGPGPNR